MSHAILTLVTPLPQRPAAPRVHSRPPPLIQMPVTTGSAGSDRATPAAARSSSSLNPRHSLRLDAFEQLPVQAAAGERDLAGTLRAVEEQHQLARMIEAGPAEIMPGNQARLPPAVSQLQRRQRLDAAAQDAVGPADDIALGVRFRDRLCFRQLPPAGQRLCRTAARRGFCRCRCKALSLGLCIA